MNDIAQRIKESQDKGGMLRRALERIIQLYTDRSHFIYELLQNAEDAEATSIKFVQYADRLEVLHNGKPFTEQNLQGLCDIGKSDKIDNLNQIGEFGVGFKSVFGICETVRLYSEPSHFRNKNIDNANAFGVEILDFTNPVNIGRVNFDKLYTTKFVFPYAVGKKFSSFKSIEELNNTITAKLQNLGITTLLFMKNLQLIEYQIHMDEKPIQGQYLVEKKMINNHCSIVSALGLYDDTGCKGEKTEEISYLKFSRKIDSTNNRTVDIAFPIKINDDGGYECQKTNSPYISVYFPTETESKLGFIVQGPFRTTPNRSSIPADIDENKSLALETAILLRDVILELRDTGKLNMSFIKVLPLSIKNFDYYSLFKPLYDVVKELFIKESIIPCNNGGYVSAKCAKIARGEKLTILFSDMLLSELIHDGNKYKWLPIFLTETSKEYDVVYKYFTSELRITIIRLDDLRMYFTLNKNFLPYQTDEWICELYNAFENIGAAFIKGKSDSNMLTAEIIKTSKGLFVAPFRRTDSRQFVPNVFLPSTKVKSNDIHFVDAKIYEKCRDFFDNILQLQQPNEYEFFISDIKKRYRTYCIEDEAEHIEDILRINKYIKNDEYKNEIIRIVQEHFLLKCSDGSARNAYMFNLYIPKTDNGVNIEGYYRNIAGNKFFVDTNFYSQHNITNEMLCLMGVKNTLIYADDVMNGNEYVANRKYYWHTSGDFRWKMTINSLKEAVIYISKNPEAIDSIVKSKTIMDILFMYESSLLGNVIFPGSIPNLENETCEMIKILRGERTGDWNGNWLYTSDGEVVSQKNISKHELDTAIYGKVKSNSVVYELLGFKKSQADELEQLRSVVPKTQLDAYFEDELRRRYGITSSDLSERYGALDTAEVSSDSNQTVYEFPTASIKNWDALRKHAVEMLCYADPVKYEYAIRMIRVSNSSKEARSYLLSMYRYDNMHKYACQMCHDSCSNIEAVQIFNNPDTELDPMNLCLCPNCATKYRSIRGNNVSMNLFRERIKAVKENYILGHEHITLQLEDKEIWFTQVHIGEIQALLTLKSEAKNVINLAQGKNTEKDSKNGHNAYLAYEGKYLIKEGFVGKVLKVVLDTNEENNGYLKVKVLKGRKIDSVIDLQLYFLRTHPDVYQVTETKPDCT